MKPKLFIDRPILAGCISVLILMLGIIGLTNLPMEQYPDIAPPTVQVSAPYTGASAETVQMCIRDRPDSAKGSRLPPSPHPTSKTFSGRSPTICFIYGI